MDRRGNDKELHCDKEGDSTVVELKVGSQTLQHVVAVKPDGKGSEYSLVYVRTQGTDKEEPI
jgi:outer membrane lipopolysaccharide assembly protein LptE/RlpB